MKRYLKYVLLALATVWAFVLVAIMAPKFIAIHAETRAVEKVFDSYIQDITDGQFEKAYGLCSDDFHSALSTTQFVEQQELLRSRYGRLLKVKRQGMKVSESGEPEFWDAEFSSDFRYEKATRRFEFSFRKQLGHWVVFGYRELGPAAQ